MAVRTTVHLSLCHHEVGTPSDTDSGAGCVRACVGAGAGGCGYERACVSMMFQRT
jgi:hypothetical protein